MTFSKCNRMHFHFLSLLLAILLPYNTANVEIDSRSLGDGLDNIYGKVIFSSILFRHGDRTIIQTYPKDPYRFHFFWPEGFGQLIKPGKRRAFDLGMWTRHHYSSLISGRSYHSDLLLLNSSDIDRTIMTAQVFLAGFLPPTSENETWNEHLHWQPIPVRTIPSFLDNIIAMYVPCKKYETEVENLIKSNEMHEYYEKYRSTFEYVQKWSGLEFSKNDIYTTLTTFSYFYDALFVEQLRGLPLPPWTSRVYPEPSKSISAFSFEIYSHTSQMKRLKGGPLLKLMIADMVQKRDDPKFTRTFQIYSGHDLTIATLLNTLRLYDGVPPPYSSAVFVELRLKEGEFIVLLLYRKSALLPPQILKIPGCNDPCTLDQFIEVTSPVVPDNWEEECLN